MSNTVTFVGVEKVDAVLQYDNFKRKYVGRLIVLDEKHHTEPGLYMIKVWYKVS